MLCLGARHAGTPAAQNHHRGNGRQYNKNHDQVNDIDLPADFSFFINDRHRNPP